MQVNIALNGEPILLKNIRISLSMELPDKDQSGQSSGNATTEQGIKAKKLKVNGQIEFNQIDRLYRIYQLAGAMNAGKKQLYRVANNTTRAVSFREACFSGSVDANESDGLLAWDVSFTLVEYISVPEKKENRSDSKVKSKVQSKDGKAVDTADPEQELSWFEENVMKKADKFAGYLFGDSDDNDKKK